MYDLNWMAYKFNKYKGWFLYQKKYFNNYHEKRATRKN